MKIKELFTEEVANVPDKLYHATFKPYLKKIMSVGLIPNKKRKAWVGSRNVVCLSDDQEVALSFAEEADNVPEDYVDYIEILEVDTSKIDKSKLFYDANVATNSPTNAYLEYHGIILPSAIRIL
jgi:hypothetical protein